MGGGNRGAKEGLCGCVCVCVCVCVCEWERHQVQFCDLSCYSWNFLSVYFFVCARHLVFALIAVGHMSSFSFHSTVHIKFQSCTCNFKAIKTVCRFYILVFHFFIYLFFFILDLFIFCHIYLTIFTFIFTCYFCGANAWRIKVILILSLIYPGLYTSHYRAEAVPPYLKKEKKRWANTMCHKKKKKKKKKIKFPLGFPSSWENVVTIYVSQLSAQWCPTANSWCSFYVFSPLPLKAVHHCIKSFVAPDEAAFHLVNCLRWCHLVTMLHCGWCRRQVLKWNKNVKPT